MSRQSPSRRELDSIQRISRAEANRLVADRRAVLVDTRDRRFYAETHAQGAISIPLDQIQRDPRQPRLEAVPLEQTIILYCT
jgi:rhodanese-related sulfurtransferase